MKIKWQLSLVQRMLHHIHNSRNSIRSIGYCYIQRSIEYSCETHIYSTSSPINVPSMRLCLLYPYIFHLQSYQCTHIYSTSSPINVPIYIPPPVLSMYPYIFHLQSYQCTHIYSTSSPINVPIYIPPPVLSMYPYIFHNNDPFIVCWYQKRWFV